MNLVKGMFLGAAMMFALIAGWLLLLFGHFFGPEHAIGVGAILAATIWSPIFWGVGVGVVVLGIIGMQLSR